MLEHPEHPPPVSAPVYMYDCSPYKSMVQVLQFAHWCLYYIPTNCPVFRGQSHFNFLAVPPFFFFTVFNVVVLTIFIKIFKFVDFSTILSLFLFLTGW